jgi:hypothetical protein
MGTIVTSFGNEFCGRLFGKFFEKTLKGGGHDINNKTKSSTPINKHKDKDY